MTHHRRAASLPWAAAVAGFVLLALLATAVSGWALPLASATVVATTTVHAPRAGWRAAFSLSLLAALVLQVCLAWAAPHVGWSLAVDNTVAWTLAGLAAVPFAARQPAPRLSRRQGTDAVAVLLVPAGVAAYLVWTATTREHAWLGWAMTGDAANNMILNRELVTQGGLLRSQGNGAPLSTVIFSSWAAPGMEGRTAAADVRHLVLSSGELGVLLGALLSVLASVLALRVTSGSTARRVAVAVAAGSLPWLWSIVGYAFRQGFQNATPAMLVLLLAWACWVMHRAHPVAALTGLVLATWAAATAWGPVVLIPATWAVGVVLADHRALRSAGRALLLPLSALAGAATYAALVTLRDLTATGGVPGVDGAHPNYDHRWSLAAALVLLALSVLLYRRLPREAVWGYWLAVPGIAFGLWQLVRAREAAGLPLWGYYPIKLTWIVMSVATLVLFTVVHPWLGRAAHHLWRGNGLLAAVAVSAAMLYLATPPLKPASLPTLLTPVWLHDDVANDGAYERMFALMEEDPRTIVSGYWRPPGGAGFDSLTNFWLLQSGSTGIGDPLRFSAYGMDSTDPAALCWAITTWGGEVRVVTRDRRLEERLTKACPTGDFSVELAQR